MTATNAPAPDGMMGEEIRGPFNACCYRDTCRALLEALEPFAQRAEHLEPEWADHESHWHPAVGRAVTVGDLRRARAAVIRASK